MTIAQTNLNTLSCQVLSGVGRQNAEKLARLGIHSIQNLLFHLPSRYQDRTRILLIRDILPGDTIVIEGEIENISQPKMGKTRFLCRLRDASGRVNLRFFHLNSIQKRSLTVGTRLRCFGEVRFGSAGLEMIHPEYRIISDALPLPVEEFLTPIYPATEGLSQLSFRKMTEQALRLLKEGGVLEEILPKTILEQFEFPELNHALMYVHRPPTEASQNVLAEGLHVAQRRLVFEELLAHRLSLLQVKQSFQTHTANSLPHATNLKKQFLQQLSFQLTHAQQRVIAEIEQDLMHPFPMLRLVQGDVGSGKTVVAALAMLQAIENGYQVAILSPTELLAEQHYKTFQTWFQPLAISVAFLSGKMKQSLKKNTIEAIATGNVSVVVGTHAIFQKDISFAKLAFIIVDEQHRFGVQQRADLREKGMKNNCYPHQMIMTATPIPRTLAMSVYADLDYSVVDELPPGRTPIKTSVVSNEKRAEVIAHLNEVCSSGRQAYWVCTLIEESEVLQCNAAENTAAELTAMLPHLKIGLIHGRMKSAEKESIMAAFKKGDLHLLVATTVIEVGVDVSNASVMIIENAERLGLAQLHQLRGRVGRGSIESYCLLVYQAPLSRLAKERLKIMRETTDGFKISQRDLELRGPGEVLGTRQTGEVGFRIANLVRDADLLPAVQKAATLLQEQFPHVIPVLIQRWLGSKQKFGHV